MSVSFVTFVKAARQDVQNVGFASAFVPFYLGWVKFWGHFKISEMCVFLKCSWSPVLEVQTVIDSTMSQKGRPGKH